MALVIEGEERIAAPINKVWEALNDPEVLKACIPGCQSLEKKSDTEMAATVVLKIGPIKATFAGEVTLKNLNPPHSYTIAGEGKGGIAGFAKGGADVRLDRGRAGRDHPQIHDESRCRRQDRPARQPADQLDLEEARRRVLLELQREGQRGLTGFAFELS